MTEARRPSQQEQFLDVIDRDEAERRLHAAIHLDPLGEELVPLDVALGRVLSRDIISPIDVPSFDRSNYDGFAVRAGDTYEAREDFPRRLKLLDEVVATAIIPQTEVAPGTALAIATGGMIPRGADAVVMVEHTDVDGDELTVRKSVTPGFGLSFAGTDVAAGETILRRAELLTSRETGVLAAVGVDSVPVWRRPRVAILSTGDEIIPPGQPMQTGQVYDSNARILADAVREASGEPTMFGIVPDDLDQLRERLGQAIDDCDVVLLSGGTSKGAGDLSYRVVSELNQPGIVAHGVALKPGKPICLAATRGKPVIILPGFPTSAIFTFHEFVSSVISRLAGMRPEDRGAERARLALKVNSEIGRTEYLLVGLVQLDETQSSDVRLAAFPMGKGSGSVTTFSNADGFVTIGRHEELIDAGTVVDVRLLGRGVRAADLVIIGSHCIGLDYLLGELQDRGWRAKFLAVGSTAGLHAAKRGECDVAGIHLLDALTGQYNQPFVTPELRLVHGYGRLQGIVFRSGDRRFEGLSAIDAIAKNRDDRGCVMVNRNQGSGTRILIDQLLIDSRPAGYAVQARSHNAVAAAVRQSRADWGVAIQPVARQANLSFLPLTHERFDFAVPRSRSERPAVAAFCELLDDEHVQAKLRNLGFDI